jgi:hypothetical protein
MAGKTNNKEKAPTEREKRALRSLRSLQEQDPYMSHNEFKEGFYDQPKPPVSYETLKGTAAKPIPNVTDTESFKEGGFARGQKAIQVKKVPFRGVF